MPPAKAIKVRMDASVHVYHSTHTDVIQTERTHEENQERAYIAASRRSDRSLEARVESARRASEIHKRRTGRSLRVTEQDVINEEMYEEEDDDLPMQYRRLAAHLTTNNADFNRRLNDYLTTHVAMRSALANSYGQQFPMPQQNTTMFPSPMLAHQQQQQPPQQQTFMQPMVQPSGSSTYRQQPYPSPHQKTLASQHQRSLSIATPQEYSAQAHGNQSNDRRFSVSATNDTMSHMNMNNQTNALGDKPRPSFPQGSFARLGQHQQQASSVLFPSYDQDDGPTHIKKPYSSFSTALPAESQMFLGSTLDFDDPLSSMFMAGADQSQIYDFGAHLPPTVEANKHQPYPSFDGLNSTLAPSASQDNAEDSMQHFAHDTSQSFFDQAIGNTPSGTPGVNGESWGNFIDTEQWNTPTSSQQW